jgi:regulator of replication initiation timing
MENELNKLASQFENGELMIASNPKHFVMMVYSEIELLRHDVKRLRKENKYLKIAEEHLKECLNKSGQ